MRLIICYKKTENMPFKEHIQKAKNPKYDPSNFKTSPVNTISHKTMINSHESVRCTSREGADRIIKNRLNVQKAYLIYHQAGEKVSEIIFQN